MHIGAGVFWVGAAVTAAVFVEPAIHDLGEDGQRFQRRLTQRRAPEIVAVAAVLTLGAGAVLYWRVSGGLLSGWILSPVGLGFTIGAIAAILAAVIAVAFLLPTLKRIEAVARDVSSGTPPAEETVSELHRLERRLRWASLGNVLMLTIAVATMATARYWG